MSLAVPLVNSVQPLHQQVLVVHLSLIHILDAAKLTVQLVREGKADIPMKGILQTSNFARAILNRETGLIPASGKRLVSQCGIFEYEGRLVMLPDAAINIAPDVDTQIGTVENALPVAHALS